MRKRKVPEELIEQATAFNETEDEAILGARNDFKEKSNFKQSTAELLGISEPNVTYKKPLPVDTINKFFGVEKGQNDAEIIEKHFTLARNLPGPDHKASLEPNELEKMVQDIRHIELAIGSGDKTPSPSEKKNIAVARKSIVAKTDIKAGEIFTEENITVKRPGNGISPMQWFDILGKTAKKDFLEDELIEL